MKSIFLAFAMFAMLNASASVEHTEAELSVPTPAEMTRNRSCFQELEQRGCGDPGEEARHFRSCLRETYGSLSSECQELMTKLYSRKI